LLRVADRLAGRRITDALQVIEVAVRVAGLALRGVAEQARQVGVTLDVGDLGEIEVATVRLRLAGERFLEVCVGLAALELSHCRDSSCGALSYHRRADRATSAGIEVRRERVDHVVDHSPRRGALAGR